MALTVACSFCERCGILSARIRTHYSRGTTAAAKTTTRTTSVRRLLPCFMFYAVYFFVRELRCLWPLRDPEHTPPVKRPLLWINVTFSHFITCRLASLTQITGLHSWHSNNLWAVCKDDFCWLTCCGAYLLHADFKAARILSLLNVTDAQVIRVNVALWQRRDVASRRESEFGALRVSCRNLSEICKDGRNSVSRALHGLGHGMSWMGRS